MSGKKKAQRDLAEIRNAARARGGKGGLVSSGKNTHLDIEILVDLENLAKSVDELHEIGKLPAIPQALEQARLLGLLLLGRGLHLGVGAFSRYHGGGRETVRRRGAGGDGPSRFLSRRRTQKSLR